MSEIIEKKTPGEIAILRDAAKISSDILGEIRLRVKPGVSTKELDELANRLIALASAEPAFLGYRGYPATICASLNNELVHGIPSKDRIIKDGDILSIDMGVKYRGFYGDLAETLAVGKISEETTALLKITYASLGKAIENCIAGNRIGDVASAIQSYVEGECAAYGMFVIRDYVGHGIGRALHEKPEVPNFGKAGKGARLFEGMVFTIEPMVALGSYEVRTLEDNWTVVTENGKLCAHYEHTILITADGPEVLTRIQGY